MDHHLLSGYVPKLNAWHLEASYSTRTRTHHLPCLRFLGALASRRFPLTLSLYLYWNAAVFRAAVEASLVDDSEKRKITMERLIAAGQEEVDKDNDGKRPAGMYT